MLLLKILFCLCIGSLNGITYDLFTGKPATKTQFKSYQEKNNLDICTADIKPCDPQEWKRLDGSCINLKYPGRGVHRTPSIKVLSPVFSPNYDPRKSEDGSPLPLPRNVRTDILRVGRASDLRITQVFAYYILFMNGDVNSIHDIVNYVQNKTYCCTPKGKKDYVCTPNHIPVDDPVHRFSGISCMNLTRPQSYQTYGCLKNGTTFVRMVFNTPSFDLSQIYNSMPGYIDRLRTFKNGLLKVEEDHGYLFPPSDPDSVYCPLNQPPRETRCHMYHPNPVVHSNLLIILFYRQHNYIAKELQRLNPCWNDERIFYTARDINIAIEMQIFLYELLPVIFGKRNMIRDGLISYSEGFRDLYDETVAPQISDEFFYILRWFHIIQETRLKFYDREGYFVKTFPLVNITTRTGFLPIDNNLEFITQGSFRQAGGRFDTTIDYDMADRVLGDLQLSSDVAMNDLAKGRFFGFQPYIKYREFCAKRPYKSFSDLRDVLTPERTHRLRQKYKHPKDIELMAALWVEKHMKGGKVPQTLYCLMTEQLKRSIVSDRHWYERPNRPHAFTLEQLKAIRKVTLAGMFCTVGDFVTRIQPNAFYTISSANPLTKCSSSKIGKLNVASWKDPKCNRGDICSTRAELTAI